MCGLLSVCQRPGHLQRKNIGPPSLLSGRLSQRRHVWGRGSQIRTYTEPVQGVTRFSSVSWLLEDIFEGGGSVGSQLNLITLHDPFSGGGNTRATEAYQAVSRRARGSKGIAYQGRVSRPGKHTRNIQVPHRTAVTRSSSALGWIRVFRSYVKDTGT